MNDTWAKVKWMWCHIRSFVPSLSVTLIIGAICSLSGVFIALLSKHLIDTAASGQTHQIFRYILIISIIIPLDTGLRAISSIISARNSVKVTNKIQAALYHRLTHIDWLDLSRYHSGDILTRMTNDVDAVANLIVSSVPSIISLGVALMASLITLFIFDPSLAMLALSLGPISIILTRILGRKIKRVYLKLQQTEANYRSFLYESLQNMVIVKAFGLEEIRSSEILKLQRNKLDLVSSRSRISAASNSVLILSSWLGYFLVFGWGALNLSKGISIFGTFTAFLQLVGNVQGPFAGLARIFPQVVSAFASVERLMEFEDLHLDVKVDYVGSITSPGIQFDNVSFGYKTDTPVLKDISFKLQPGEIIALIGSSGEGKTTLVRLLLSLVQATKGQAYITYGAEKVRVSASSRKIISYVPQGNTLFSGTIADNLLYGNPNASDEEVEAAARAACAWDFIELLPKGLYTLIGEQGHGLSEGQAQRVAIARALLRQSPILILDEATSALDMNTELKVLQAIRNLRPLTTCIIITHRSTALKICKRVLKLENGHIIDLTNKTIEDPASEAI